MKKSLKENFSKVLPAFSIILTIVGLLLTIFSVFKGISQEKMQSMLDKENDKLERLRKDLDDEKEKLKNVEKEIRTIDWNQIESMADEISDSIVNQKFIPDVIVAPSPKGGIIAFLVSRHITRRIRQDRNNEVIIPIITGFSRSSLIRHSNDKRKITNIDELKKAYHLVETDRFYIFLPKQELLDTTQRVLIVDDRTLRGGTIKGIKNLLIDNHYKADNIKSFVIATNIKKKSDGNKVMNDKYRYNIIDYCGREVSSDILYFPWGKSE